MVEKAGNVKSSIGLLLPLAQISGVARKLRDARKGRAEALLCFRATTALERRETV
jgi:hypothetical protein